MDVLVGGCDETASVSCVPGDVSDEVAIPESSPASEHRHGRTA